MASLLSVLKEIGEQYKFCGRTRQTKYKSSKPKHFITRTDT